jgi:DNA invertase Pin-like site-specific DNA recombinase
MIYGYARVSTDAQDLTSQLAQLKAAGCEKVYREKITGTTADRPQLRKLMAALVDRARSAAQLVTACTARKSFPSTRRAGRP